MGDVGNKGEVATTNTFICDGGCGAPMVYKPGTHQLICDYCGSIKEIKQVSKKNVKLRYNDYVRGFEKENLSLTKVITCCNCKATPTVDEKLQSMICPYCCSPLLDKDIHHERYIKPGYISPFRIEKKQINQILGDWIKGLWYAPSTLKKAALSPLSLKGIYVPFWTFDLHTVTDYRGERGYAYYVKVEKDGKEVEEERVDWTDVSGTVRNFYNDILVKGTNSLDHALLKKIEGWDISNLLKINESYLAGYITEKYQIDLQQAFSMTKPVIDAAELRSVRDDIGGDRQRVIYKNTHCSDITFKHILLPVYVSSFRYKNKLYYFYVNGLNGRIAGKRPYSVLKIIFAVLFVILLVVAFLYFLINYKPDTY